MILLLFLLRRLRPEKASAVSSVLGISAAGLFGGGRGGIGSVCVLRVCLRFPSRLFLWLGKTFGGCRWWTWWGLVDGWEEG